MNVRKLGTGLLLGCGTMELVEASGKRRDLRAGFDEAAEAYQRTRPVCPPPLFDDLVRLAGSFPETGWPRSAVAPGRRPCLLQSGDWLSPLSS